MEPEYSNQPFKDEIYRVLLETASEGIVFIDERGLIRLINKRIETLFDYQREELIGQPIEILVPESLRNRHIHHRTDYGEHPSHRAMGRGRYLSGRRKDGSEFPVEVSLNFVATAGGIWVMALIVDITERIRAAELAKLHEQQLMQADKMASLGILVSGVAHEINNPNNFISLNGKILSKVWKDAEPILEKYYRENGDFILAGMPYSRAYQKIEQLIEGISEGSKRIQRIVESLKNFARRDDGELNQVVDINAVVESSIIIVQNLIKKSTNRFSTDLQKNLPPIKGNFQQLEQVVMNLITNACQAITNPESALMVSTFYDKKSRHVVLKVEDEGSGISRENLNRIMDPFFTTKQGSGGTGLGLSISYNIVKNHGGFLKITSQEGNGTDVLVRIPVKS
jgi:PAS domain S-box-containing protein